MKAAAVLSLLLATTAVFAQSQAAKKPLPELDHINVLSVDNSISACDNFYAHVCNPQFAAEPIPADQIVWGVGSKLQMWNRQVLRTILESAETPGPDRTPNQQKIGDFYASCVTQADSGTNDLAAVQPLLRQIAAMHSKDEIAAVLANLHRSFGHTWEGGDNQTDVAMFGYGPTADYNDVSRVVAGVDQGGLGLPGRDFYLKDDADSKNIRDMYVQLITKLLTMSGETEADAKAHSAVVVQLETSLARAQLDNISRRDPAKGNNRYTLAELKALMPAFRWDDYLAAVHAPSVPLYEVAHPPFLKEENRLLREESLATWQTYLRWQVLLAAAPYLGNAWRDAQFMYLDQPLTGAKKQPPTWRRCTAQTDRVLGEALGQVYVSQVFPPDSKARAQQLVKNIEAAMGRDLDSVTWMQPATKQEAHLKLAAVMDKIGYPDKWIDYSTLAIQRDSYPENISRGTAFEFTRQLGFIGKPLDRTQWGMTPPTVDAYEDAQTNTINFPAGILQPIFFDPTKDDVINYGSEGAVVGHELTHGFDDQGRKFDVKGNLRDWWTPEDAKQYDQRGECIAKEYTGPVPGLKDVQQNGKLTQGEDTADNGGLYLALSALKEDLRQHGQTLDDKDASGLTNLQRFFIAFSNTWCDQIRPEALRTMVLTNPHSLPQLRVNNVVGNMPEFAQAFGCKAGQPMVHAQQCRVW